MAEPRAAGTIYDLGYQRYTGVRYGRGHSVWRLIAFSFRQAWGLGRGGRARQAPIIIAIIAFIPAVVQIGIASMTGQATFINYASYLNFTSFLIALFTAAQAPELIIPDRQHGVLPLYVSRPILGIDYALAKLAALVLAMFALTVLPQLFLFVGKVFISATPWPAFKDEWRKLLPIIGGTLGTSLLMATLGLAIASFAARKAFGNAAVIAYFLAMPAAVTIIHSIATGDTKKYSVLFHPVWLINGFASWLFDVEARRRSVIARTDLPGTAYLYTLLAFSLVAGGVLVWRYRRRGS